MLYLRENLTNKEANVVYEATEKADGGKDLYMKGICIQGGVKNANQRVYPVSEISNAVDTINEQLKNGNSVLGEVDHPDDLKINLDRVSHTIESMWMDGPNGYGKLKILETPMGKLVKTMIEGGVNLGVSSRGSGEVNESSGNVSNFEIVTVDIVAQPSAPNAYPVAIYEGLLNMKGGAQVLEMAREANANDKVQKYLREEMLRLIRDLKIQEINMLDAIKPLLDSDLVNEDTRTAIQEEWDAKMGEVRNQVTAELREEFAQRYEHDKSTMVEALDRMVTEGLTTELSQIAEERKAIAEDRAKFVSKMKESSETFDSFLLKTLSEEIAELRSERAQQQDVIGKLEQFVTAQLAEEIGEFQKDRQDVVETKVRLVKEARSKFDELKTNFVKRTGAAVNEAVTDYLKGEMNQLKEDIQIAKENTFGRKIFETFATEFSASHLNENQKIKELEAELASQAELVAEVNEKLEETSKIVESKEQEIAMINETVERKDTLSTLLKPLNKDKAAIMTDLLESVQTSKLQAAFDRYLPAVLDGKQAKAAPKKEVIAESREVTGDKEQKTVQASTDDSNIVDIRKLAGLK